MSNTFSRRGFLGLGAMAVAAGAGLAACAPQSPSSTTGELAATGEGRWSWSTMPDPIEDISQTEDYDIVVVGCGTAGTAALLTAAQAGASVAVIEPFETCSCHGSMIGAVDCQVQRDAGVNVDRKGLVDYMVEFTTGKTNIQLFLNWVNNSGEAIDFVNEVMERRTGIIPVPSMTEVGGGEARFPGEALTYQKDGLGGEAMPGMMSDEPSGMAAVAPALLEEAQSLGAVCHFNTTAKQLVSDEAGRVTGVVAQKDDGSYIQLNASKGVILATGDYAANAEMCEAWCPTALRADEGTHQWVPELDKGEGIAMALWAGAGMQHYPHAAMVHPTAGGNMAAASYCSLRVNGEGRRFSQERGGVMYGTAQRMGAQGNLVWTVVDSKMTGENPLVMMGLKDGSIIQADTIDELTDAMGVDAATFAETLDRYNELCAKGIDEDFWKDPDQMIPIDTPPFFAMHVPAALLVTLGGLNVSSSYEVLSEDDSAIEGLYAIGNVAGNFYANDYPMDITGLSLGRALTEGYLVAKTLATA